MTRRKFLYGAASVGAVGAAAAGGWVLSQAREESSSSSLESLSVEEGYVATIDDFREVNAEDFFTNTKSYELPFGSLIWMTDDNFATCLIPTEGTSPITTVGLLALSTGQLTTVLKQARGTEDGYDIYDVRGNGQGLIWTEANIFEGLWRIYCAKLNNDFTLSEIRIVDEGDSSVQTPYIAIAGDYGFWTRMPQATADDARTGEAKLMRASLASGNAQTFFESAGRHACAPYSASGSIAIAPRHPDSSRYFQLTALDASSGSVLDTLTLPSSMRPNEIGYGTSGFAFCLDAIYEVGGAIGGLGTYTPTTTPNGSYEDLRWFRFARTPYGPPCWMDNGWMIVKSNMAAFAVDTANKQYCSFDAPSGTTSWGDYLTTSGTNSAFLLAAQINKTTTSSKVTQNCDVRLWREKTASATQDSEESSTQDSE